jgi:hypothetical protein
MRQNLTISPEEITYFDYHNLESIDKSHCIIHIQERLTNLDLSFTHQNRVKKLFFFLTREGIIRLYLKLRAKLLFDSALSDTVFLVVENKINNKFYYGFQFSKDQNFYYFFSSNISSTFPENIPEDIKYYNPFSGYRKIGLHSNGVFNPIEYSSQRKNINNKRELYLIGSGRYVLTEILPIFKSYYNKAVCDFNFNILNLHIYKDFEYRTNDFKKIISLNTTNKNEKLGVISSYHSYHTEQATEFLKLESSKVILEKPPCVTMDDFKLLLSVYNTKRLFISYHRRYAIWNLKIKKILARSSKPFIANFQIHEKRISPFHWYYWPNQGTRISGNLCHWIDLSIFLFGEPTEIFISKNPDGIDFSNFSLLFKNHSLASFNYSDFGDMTRGVQEFINIRGNDLEITIKDYLSLKIWNKGKVYKKLNRIRDKGHIRMNRRIKECIDNNYPSDYSREDFIYTTLTYIKVVELMNSDQSSMKLDFTQFNGNETTNPTT